MNTSPVPTMANLRSRHAGAGEPTRSDPDAVPFDQVLLPRIEHQEPHDPAPDRPRARIRGLHSKSEPPAELPSTDDPSTVATLAVVGGALGYRSDPPGWARPTHPEVAVDSAVVGRTPEGSDTIVDELAVSSVSVDAAGPAEPEPSSLLIEGSPAYVGTTRDTVGTVAAPTNTDPAAAPVHGTVPGDADESITTADATSAPMHADSASTPTDATVAREAAHIASQVGAPLVDTEDVADAEDPGGEVPEGGDVDIPETTAASTLRTADTVSVARPGNVPAATTLTEDPAVTSDLAARQRAADHAQANELLARAELRRATHGGSQLELEADGGDLGPIRIEALDRGDGLQLNLRSDQAATRALLGQHIDELRDQLRAGGFDLGSVDVGTGRGARDDTRPSNGPAGQLPSGNRSTNATDAPSTDATAGIADVAPVDGIDLRI